MECSAAIYVKQGEAEFKHAVSGGETAWKYNSCSIRVKRSPIKFGLFLPYNYKLFSQACNHMAQVSRTWSEACHTNEVL